MNRMSLMSRLSLRWKTILGVALIESVLLVLLVSLMMGHMRESNNDGLVKRAQTVATLFATTSKDATLSYDLASLESFVKEVMKNPDLSYARVRSSDGTVLAAAGLPREVSKPFSADKSLDSVDDGVYDATAPIREGGTLFGAVEIGINITEIVSTVDELATWSYSIAALELCLVALFSFMLGTYLTSQLAVLRQAARSVAKNELDVAIPIKSLDEVGEVATAFNSMIKGLKESRQERDEYDAQLVALNETLEQRVARRTNQLQESLDRLHLAKADLEREGVERQKAESEMRQAQKLEAVGHLAAGVAHEINTPIQFIGDSMLFVRDAVKDIRDYNAQLKEMAVARDGDEIRNLTIEKIEQIEDDLDIEYLSENTPDAIDRALKGLERVSEIVSAMKAFGTTRNVKRELACINQAVEQTIVVSRHQHRYCAIVTTDLEENLPLTNCHISEITQVFLNIVLNASDAVSDRYGEGDHGKIHVATCRVENSIVITFSDNGTGIPDDVQDKIFDPFFTTKEVGSGTGQGLAIAYDSVVNVHGGAISVTSEPGEGTVFTVTMPLEANDFRKYLKNDLSAAMV